MKDLFDAFWRAVLSCLHPRVILWSMLPLAVSCAVVLTAGWLWWTPAVTAVASALEEWTLLASLLKWLEPIGADAGALRQWVAPLLVLALSVPAVVVLTLLVVAWLMTPAMVERVAAQRFPGLDRRGGLVAWGQGVIWSLGCTALALLVLVLSLPLWLVPPLALIIPALVWGWLAARVFTFDTLSVHADASERRWIAHSQRWPLLFIGVVSGLLGAVPAWVWAFGALGIVFAPFLAALSVWLYTLVFVFAALWFAHFTLSSLARLREVKSRTPDVPPDASLASGAPFAVSAPGAAPAVPPPLPGPSPS
jgi:hypothetical protein